MTKLKKAGLSKEEADIQMKTLMNWVDRQLALNDVPRISDVVDHSRRMLGFKMLKRAAIARELRLHTSYLMTSPQQRLRLRSRKDRPVLVNYLGALHCDLGFFSIHRKNTTQAPKKKSSGFMVGVDVCSNYIYLHNMEFNRKAPSIIKAFKDLIDQFESRNEGAKVKSVSFDQERSVVGNQVQDFFKENKIKFHAFQFTDSKAKLAENAIGRIRNTLEKLLERPDQKERRWWFLIDGVVESLNRRPRLVNGKFIKKPDADPEQPYYLVKDIVPSNVKDFVNKAQKADAAYYFTQYEVDPRLTRFKFKEGDFVRPKIIATSSQVLVGNKRSEVTLETEIFRVEKQIPFVSRAVTVQQAYRCKSLSTGKSEIFGEGDIALTKGPFDI